MPGNPLLRHPTPRKPALLWIPAVFLLTLAALWWTGALQQSFSSTYLPHGFCFNWNSHLLWFHVSSDLIIALSYLSISTTLAILVLRARGAIPFSWLFLAFGAFIVACGMTHLMEIVTLWLPYYWLSGNIKVLTAIASLSTAIALPAMVPSILDVLHSAQLSEKRRAQLEAAQGVLQGELAAKGETLEKLSSDIAETRLLLASIVDSSQDAIISRDLDGIITSWNRGAELIYGYSAPEVVGKPFEILLPESTGKALLEQELASMKAGQRHLESKRTTRDGRVLDVALTTSPIYNYSGLEIGISTIGRDITNQKLAEDALRTSEKLAAAGRLASSISHEINNPLEAVMNLLYLIEADAEAGSKLGEYAAKAQEEMRHVAHITRQTLAFYRDSTRPVHIDLREVVDSLFEIFQRDMREKSISATVIMDPGLFLVGFPGELRQVFANLIRNAIEAMPPHGQLEVRGTRIDGGFVRLDVRDSGPGVPPENRSHIFEPFYTTKGENGTGLGLWVTEGIIHKHAGTITVTSPPEDTERGTEFTVILPQKAFTVAD